MGVAELVGTYADIGPAGSLSVLRSRLADRGIHHGLSDIDGAATRLIAPCGFTSEVSRLVYECRTDGVHPSRPPSAVGKARPAKSEGSQGVREAQRSPPRLR